MLISSSRMTGMRSGLSAIGISGRWACSRISTILDICCDLAKIRANNRLWHTLKPAEQTELVIKKPEQGSYLAALISRVPYVGDLLN
jgi:hypothetical protein